jgi:hypothetical protein
MYRNLVGNIYGKSSALLLLIPFRSFTNMATTDNSCL